ncbi:MAG: glutamate 5-kinase [Pseudomonadota bacterium]
MHICEGVEHNHIQRAERIAIKVGSSLLINSKTGELNRGWFDAFIKDVAALRQAGKEVIIISSGAVALGRRTLGVVPDADRPDKTEASACAAVGQIELAHAYQDALKDYNIPVGLILITTQNTEIRSMYLNLRDTTDTLLAANAIPVVNENDAVSDRDDCYGDNDRLAARIAGMANADLLILFSDIDGLYTDNPRRNPDAKFISIVDDISDDIHAMASGAGSNVGSGGMATKLLAAVIARSAGCDMIITNGTVLHPLERVINGGKLTYFPAGDAAKTARKHWIIGTPEPNGSVVIDKGAVKALHSGSSLLPIGIKSVSGTFVRGDCVSVFDEKHNEIARGLAGYDSDEVFKILGRHTKDISKLLGYIRKGEFIHRNDLALYE